MLDHSLTLKDRALALRLDHGLSVRAIGERLGVPRSTVGGWLGGQGECHFTRDCLLCKHTFFAGSDLARFCGSRCRKKHLAVFGPLSA